MSVGPARLRFRRMTLSDVKRVMKVEQEVYQFPWTERIFSDCIRVGYHCWLALQGQDIVGHAVISVTAGESHMLARPRSKQRLSGGAPQQYSGHQLL